MNSKLTPKHKQMTYILNEEFGYSMRDIAKLMGVSASTISNVIKEMRYEVQITNLRKELELVKNELTQLGYTPPIEKKMISLN